MTSIPTIAQLYTSILSDLQTEFGFTINPLGKAYLRAYAAVQAGKLKLIYLAIGLLQKNIFADTADPEAAGGTLERFGRVKIGRNPYPATQGKYTITVTGNAGAIIPAATGFKSDDDSLSPGILYTLDTAYTMPGTSGTITVRALTSGVAGKLAIGDTLTATAPIIGVNDGAIVATEVTAPADAEGIEDYRKVVLQSFRLYPQGGASADYRLWGLDAQGVKQIYPYAASGAPNEVNVFVEATVAASTDGMGTPTSTILTDVAADIETDPVTGKGRRPLGVFKVNVQAVVVNKLAITIPGASGISAANRTLITAALTDAVNAVRPFIAGADVLAAKNDIFGINNIISVILTTVPGAVFNTPTLSYQIGAGSPVPITTRVFDNGNIPYLNSVTYA